MSEKEFVHAEVEPNKQLCVQMCCAPDTLVAIIATMLMEVAKRRGQMSVRKMLDDIIRLTESEEKEVDQMIDETLRRIDK